MAGTKWELRENIGKLVGSKTKQWKLVGNFSKKREVGGNFDLTVGSG